MGMSHPTNGCCRIPRDLFYGAQLTWDSLGGPERRGVPSVLHDLGCRGARVSPSMQPAPEDEPPECYADDHRGNGRRRGERR